MNTLTNAELTELHTETLSEIAHARTMANITRRASRLFFEDGYTAYENIPGDYVRCFRVTSPKGDTYNVKVSKAPAAPGTFFGSRCSCPCFVKELTCKHLQALQMMIDNEDAQCNAYDAMIASAECSTGCDPYAEF